MQAGHKKLFWALAVEALVIGLMISIPITIGVIISQVGWTAKSALTGLIFFVGLEASVYLLLYLEMFSPGKPLGPYECAGVMRNGVKHRLVGPGGLPRVLKVFGVEELLKFSLEPITVKVPIRSAQTKDNKNMDLDLTATFVASQENGWAFLRWQTPEKFGEKAASFLKEFAHEACRKLDAQQVLDRAGKMLATELKDSFENLKVEPDEGGAKRIGLEEFLGGNFLNAIVEEAEPSAAIREARDYAEAVQVRAEADAGAEEKKAEGVAALIQKKGEALLGIAGAKGIRGADKNLLALLASGQGNPLYVSLNKEAAQAAHGLGQVGEGVMREGLGLLAKVTGGGGRPGRGGRRDRDDRKPNLPSGGSPATMPPQPPSPAVPAPAKPAASKKPPVQPPTTPPEKAVVLEEEQSPSPPPDVAQKVSPLATNPEEIHTDPVQERKSQNMDAVLGGSPSPEIDLDKIRDLLRDD